MLEGEIQGNIQVEIQGRTQGKIQGRIHGEIQGRIQGKIQDRVQGKQKRGRPRCSYIVWACKDIGVSTDVVWWELQGMVEWHDQTKSISACGLNSLIMVMIASL